MNVRLDHAAFGRNLLNSAAVVEECRSRAERAKAFAESISPDAPPYGEGYISSFEVESGVEGGVNHDRAYAVLRNTSQHARYIEHGTEHNDAHHVLSRASDVALG